MSKHKNTVKVNRQQHLNLNQPYHNQTYSHALPAMMYEDMLSLK